MDVLELTHIGQIQKARIEFGDLTVLVGPQATGKSIALQLFHGLVDLARIQTELKRHGLEWNAKREGFLDLLLGEGMRSIWSEDSTLKINGKETNLARKPRAGKDEPEPDASPAMFYIPAQRVLTWRDGWPRPFTDYSSGDPFSVRDFSERMRLLMEKEFVKGEILFPKANRLKSIYRDMMKVNLFGGFELKVDRSRAQKRMVLHQEQGDDLPFMVWSAGQREFMPLLLGLYWLMPPARLTKRDGCEWVIIEELKWGCIHAPST